MAIYLELIDTKEIEILTDTVFQFFLEISNSASSHVAKKWRRSYISRCFHSGWLCLSLFLLLKDFKNTPFLGVFHPRKAIIFFLRKAIQRESKLNITLVINLSRECLVLYFSVRMKNWWKYTWFLCKKCYPLKFAKVCYLTMGIFNKKP